MRRMGGARRCEVIGFRKKASMKMSIDIECTPIEARQFLGLPNVEPMQAAVMEQLEKRMLANIDRFSPEALMQSWLTLGPQSAEHVQSFFRSVLSPQKMAQGESERKS
jgi:hypothetical protein